MKYYTTSVTALCLAAGSVHAGALDRSGQSVDVLFEDGRYMEFSAAIVSPKLSGQDVVFGTGGSGDIAASYTQLSFAYKADLNDRLSYAFIFDEPFKADTEYPGGTGYFAADSFAEWQSYALTGLLQYNLPSSGLSVYGGVRFQSAEAEVSLQANIAAAGTTLDYRAEAARDWGIGYVAGVAYEKPEIAMRVSLTYNSQITYSNDTIENSTGASAAGFFAGNPNTANSGGALSSTTNFKTPESVNLAFQTGVAPGTLVFGGVRWVNWSDFDLSPAFYISDVVGLPLLTYRDDIFTYTLGVGRKLSDTWSVAASIGYEKSSGAFFTNLGPSDGQKSIGLAAIYTRDNMKITTGIRYVRIGDTQTRLGPVEPLSAFNDNDAIALGVKVGWSF
ncbi:MAG: OmpP1/FadL family transporter [Roseobacter sp.]